MTDQKFTFRVKAGYKFAQGTDHEARGGQIVELTIEEAKGFCYHTNPAFDTLEPVSAPRSLRDKVKSKPIKTPFEQAVLDASEGNSEDEETDSEEESGAVDYQSMTKKQLMELPEWELVPEPKPTLKAQIVAAIEEVAG